MLQIAVCDDDRLMQEYLKQLIDRVVPASVDFYASGKELLESGRDYDILLLDICFQESAKDGRMNGIETARRLRENSDALIIFITASEEYVYDAYDVEAFHYLLKPIHEEKFFEVMKRAVEKASERQGQIPLVIKAKGVSKQIPREDIYYAESNARKIILHTKNGSFTYYEKMEGLEQKLGNGFFRCHRGYLVNLAEVAGYDRSSIVLKCGEKVYLAKQKYHDFVDVYMSYLTR